MYLVIVSRLSLQNEISDVVQQFGWSIYVFKRRASCVVGMK